MKRSYSDKEARQAGINGLPEPSIVTKHVRYRDPISWLWVEGDVETDVSIARRAAWAKGRKQRDVQEWARTRNGQGSNTSAADGTT